MKRPPRKLIDSFGRRVSYLRVSLTDRCNYRCTYCMPEEGVAVSTRSAVLSYGELERTVRVFAGLGVRRVRFTGGEPLIRRGVVHLVRRIHAIVGIEEICLTTNGHLLGKYARPLIEAGLRGLSVSIDSLQGARFQSITRRGGLDHVIAGVKAARAAGIEKLKINTVGLRGVNDDELSDICRFAWKQGALPRFIEWMPMADGENYRSGSFLSAAEMRVLLQRSFDGALELVSEGDPSAGPARYYRAPLGGKVGFISAMTENFCSTCNRLRVTATGELHTCLARDDSLSLRDLMRAGATDEDLVATIRKAVSLKQEGHEFTTLGCGGPRKQMVSIGG